MEGVGAGVHRAGGLVSLDQIGVTLISAFLLQRTGQPLGLSQTGKHTSDASFFQASEEPWASKPQH